MNWPVKALGAVEDWNFPITKWTNLNVSDRHLNRDDAFEISLRLEGDLIFKSNSFQFYLI